MALQKITTDLISADAVTAAKIADGAIGADDIATNSITSVKIAQNSILTKHIDDDQVTGDQLADAITVVTSVTTPALVGSTSATAPLVVASTSARVTQVAITSSSVTQQRGMPPQQQMLIMLQQRTQHSQHQVTLQKEQSYQVELAQGGTARTIAWNTVFEFAASTAPTVTATANKTDIFTFRYNGSVWQEIGEYKTQRRHKMAFLTQQQIEEVYLLAMILRTL